MIPLILAAAVLGQLPTPQSALPAERAAPPAAAPVYLLLAAPAAQAAPAAPSVLVSKPPIWDRALATTGQWLTARAARHQHPQAMQILVVTPTVATPAPAPAEPLGPCRPPVPLVTPQPAPIQLGAPPRPSAQLGAASEAVPPPPMATPSAPVMLSIDPAKLEQLQRMLGSG
jgi:hypothetical protein